MNDYSRIEISIVGFGHVGKSILHLLLQDQSRRLSINVVDPAQVALGAEFDLGPALLIDPRHELYWNDHSLLKKADFIFYSAGVAVPRGECRDFKLEQNRSIVNEVFGDVVFNHAPTIITLTNPLDAIALDILTATGVDPQQIIGIGTIIESARLKYYLHKAVSTGADKIQAYVIGEHGETMVPVLSRTTVNGIPVKSILTKDQLSKIIYDVRSTPHRIKETQPASYFSAATASVKVFHALLDRKSEVIPLSIYNESDGIFYSVPVFISKKGIQQLPLSISQEEHESLEFSKAKIQSMSNKVVV